MKIFLSCLIAVAIFSGPALASVNESLYEFTEAMSITVNIKRCEMIIYRDILGSLEEVVRLPVATVKPGIKIYPKGLGRILAVHFNPVWGPTRNQVDYLNKKSQQVGKGDSYYYGEVVSNKDKRNPLGKFKMILSHYVEGKGAIYRIHGTNQPSSIGKRASGGCIRMDNEAGLELAQNIRKRLERQEIVMVKILDL